MLGFFLSFLGPWLVVLGMWSHHPRIGDLLCYWDCENLGGNPRNRRQIACYCGFGPQHRSFVGLEPKSDRLYVGEWWEHLNFCGTFVIADCCCIFF